MRSWRVVFLLLINFSFFCKAQAQNISNEGTDFWSVFPTHDPSAQPGMPPSLAKITIYISSKYDSEVTVSCNGRSETKAIRANIVEPFDVQRSDAYIDLADINSIKPNRGIHIQVTAGKPKVAVYTHIYAGARSAASLILPKEALGQQYYSMNYTQNGDPNDGASRNFLTLIATEPNTKLLIHTNEGIRSVSFTNAGEVYEYMPLDQRDLTGTYVEIDPSSPDNCNKRFAAFSGNTSVSIGCGDPRRDSRDPLFQQLYPTASWGKTYSIVPFKNRKYLFRVLAQEDDTQINIDGTTVIRNKGQFFDTQTPLTKASFVKANKKVSVAQYSLTQTCSSATGFEERGDPEMVLLNPIEFNVKAVTLFSSTKQDISERYINVSMKTAATGTFRINGSLPDNGNWQTISSNPEYSSIQIKITDVSSTLTANDGFNAISYGFGQYESYAYSAGTNLAANNYLLIHNTVTNAETQNACLGQASNFKIVLTARAQKIVWNLEGYPPDEYNTPVPQEVLTADGMTYVYTYDREFSFPNVGKMKMLVVVTMPNENNCLGGEIEYDFDFEVMPIPRVSFLADLEACSDTPVHFTDQSNSDMPDKPTNKWFWDFGDGSTSVEQNPDHVYEKGGDYTIRLSAGRDDGCLSDFVQTIHIRPKVDAKFSVVEQACAAEVVRFTNESSVTSSPGIRILNNYWDFGDGQTSDIAEPSHFYSSAGEYTVSLIAEAENGCKSIAFEKRIVINALPEPNFSLPQVCAGDIAVFKNLTVDENGADNGFTYSWNFGDDMDASAFDGTDGQHKFSKSGVYKVTLNAKNANGCTFSSTKELEVNSSDISASFEVLDKDNLCSNEKIKIKNTSTIAFGKIIRLEWYKDNDNIPFEIDNNPELDKVYEFPYPVTGARDMDLKITLKAYSGLSCSNNTFENVIVHPKPLLEFDLIPSICIDKGKVKIIQAREALGIGGTFRFSGPPGSITEDGVFDPQVSGLGTHQITYTFLSNGCESSISQFITVYAPPQLSFEKDIYIFEGGQKKPDVTASGLNLTYKWSPSVNLDRDDVPDPVITADEDREYTLTVTSSEGCSISQKLFVHVLMDVRPPNAFSPNDDQINDTWVIKYIESYPDVVVEVFSRYGERVFYSKGYAVPFDGKFKNQPLPMGTYYYIIDPKNGRKRVTGALTILK